MLKRLIEHSIKNRKKQIFKKKKLKKLYNLNSHGCTQTFLLYLSEYLGKIFLFIKIKEKYTFMVFLDTSTLKNEVYALFKIYFQ